MEKFNNFINSEEQSIVVEKHNQTNIYLLKGIEVIRNGIKYQPIYSSYVSGSKDPSELKLEGYILNTETGKKYYGYGFHLDYSDLEYKEAVKNFYNYVLKYLKLNHFEVNELSDHWKQILRSGFECGDKKFESDIEKLAEKAVDLFDFNYGNSTVKENHKLNMLINKFDGCDELDEAVSDSISKVLTDNLFLKELEKTELTDEIKAFRFYNSLSDDIKSIKFKWIDSDYEKTIKSKWELSNELDLAVKENRDYILTYRGKTIFKKGE